MRTLYIFPHPDDESFGPAPVIYRQIQNGEEVHLLTLTRGGATKMRYKYDLSIKEMGDVRYKEMLKVKDVLGLSSMEVLDLEDGGLAKINPIDFEDLLYKKIFDLKPDIIVTYPIHGISGHHDHLYIHAILKRMMAVQRRKNNPNWTVKRLAFFTLPRPDGTEKSGGNSHVNTTKKENIDCIVNLTSLEKAKLKEALYCYETFIDVILETGVIEGIGDKVHFEFFEESFQPPIDQLTAKLASV